MYITPAEQVLLTNPLPYRIDGSTVPFMQVARFFQRWNNTVLFQGQGISTAAAVPAGQSSDFIPSDKFSAVMFVFLSFFGRSHILITDVFILGAHLPKVFKSVVKKI
jgi:hypothetical protein